MISKLQHITTHNIVLMLSLQQKLILPPPPSGKDRSSRTSETSSVLSEKVPISSGESEASAIDNSLFKDTKAGKIFNFSHEFNTSGEDRSSGDWCTPPHTNSILEEPPLVPESSSDLHETRKQEILSQFDVFTELDPLGLLCNVPDTVCLLQLLRLKFVIVKRWFGIYIFKFFL